MEAFERPQVIETARLRLLALLSREVEALIEGSTVRAGELAGVSFPQVWPEHSEARDGLGWHLNHLRNDMAQRAWRIRVIVKRETGIVVGSTNLKGPPDDRGDVEVGWGVNSDRRRRGYAFEALTAVMEWAARQPHVRMFSATIPDDNVPSQQLARKLGMERTSETRRALPLWVRVMAA
jgi:[ribosomal protein S5]-alanine N-acetyltransferase